MNRKHWPLFCLFGITLFGFLLRFYNLTWQCYNVDEVWTAFAAAKSSGAIVQWALNIDCNPPLYYLLAHWSSLAFGEVSRFAIRFPAVILGAALIPAVYFVGKELRNEILGLLAASLVSFMFPFVYYSQDGRGYTLVLLAFAGFTYFFIKMSQGDVRSRVVIGASFFTALCLWSHYYSVVPLAIAWLILLMRDRISALHGLVISGILVSPMALMFNLSNLASRAAPQTFGEGYALVNSPAVHWITPWKMALIIPNELLCWSWIVLLPLAGYCLFRYRSQTVLNLLLIAVGAACLLLPLASVTNISPRYALLISPILILIAMWPVSVWIDAQKQVDRKIVLFAVLMFGIGLMNYGSLLSWFSWNICPYVI